jgi:predicted ribosome quality control (RQC) complex YloA/Tae2 family protein
MRQICTLEAVVLARELDNLRGYRIDKFYETGKGRFRFRLSRPGSKLDIICILCEAINRSRYIEAAEMVTNFAVSVRKRIGNAVIESVRQINEDRIIAFGLSRGEERMELIFEMFGKGNLVLVGQDGVIRLAYIRHRFRDRSINTGEVYTNPKNSQASITGIAANSGVIADRLRGESGESSVIKVLTGSVNIGSIYIEDVLNGLGIQPKSAAKSLSDPQISSIIDGLNNLNRIIDSPTPIVYLDEAGKAADYALARISKYNGYKSIEFGSLQEAMEYVENNSPQPLPKKSPIAEELEVSMAKQREVMGSIIEGIERNKRAGEIIFNNMHIVNKIIEEASKDKHITKERLQELFPDVNIIDVDLKDKRIEIEMD